MSPPPLALVTELTRRSARGEQPTVNSADLLAFLHDDFPSVDRDRPNLSQRRREQSLAVRASGRDERSDVCTEGFTVKLEVSQRADLFTTEGEQAGHQTDF